MGITQTMWSMRVKVLTAIVMILAATQAMDVEMMEDQAITPLVPGVEHFAEDGVDSDEAALDNGDDTNLLEMYEGLAKKAAAAKKAPKPAATTEAAKPAVEAPKKVAKPVKKKPAAKKPVKKAPAAPSAPAGVMSNVMQRLMNMRKSMMKIKGGDWMKNLETHRDAVVQIMVTKKKFMWKAAYRAPLSEEISGSGWFIDNREFGVDTKNEMLIVTNAHVAKNAAMINILVPSLGQEPVPAQVVGLCSQRDIALLKVKNPKHLLTLYAAKTGKKSIIKLRLGDSDEMKRGARCMAVGYPLGLKSVKASMGIVSGYQQFKSALYLQTTAPINPGNSGGPLFNQDGKVVGINSAKIASASGMSFAIASVQLKVMLDVLYQRRQFIVPYLGYGFSIGTKLIQQYLAVDPKLKQSGGIYITKVHPNGLFKEAGVKKEDLLLSVDGANIDRFGQTWMPTMKDNINILGLLARKKIGSDLTLKVWRKSEGKLVTLTTKYDETPKFAVPFIYEPLLEKPKFQIFAGIVFMELVENLVETLLDSNVKELIKFMSPEARMKPAVIIAGVLPGSLADLDGSVKPGLIVQKFNGKTVSSITDICSALNGAKGGWYTLSTSKTFTALKGSDVEKDAKSDPEMRGKSAGFCASKAAAVTAKPASKVAAKAAAAVPKAGGKPAAPKAGGKPAAKAPAAY